MRKTLAGLLLLAACNQTGAENIERFEQRDVSEVVLELEPGETPEFILHMEGKSLVNAWRDHEVSVRDGLLEYDSIDALTLEALGAVHDFYSKNFSDYFSPELSRFPVEGEIVEVSPWFMGYNWDFKQSMKDKKGHPAYDIFTDSGLVVAPMDGVIISVNGEWSSDNTGGLSVGLYNPASGMHQYYAHLESIIVEQGDLVKAGKMIGGIGRTGKNAAADRSDTHLHLTSLETNVEDGHVRPYSDGDILKPLKIYDKLIELQN